jgi:hypothetical protein
LQMVLTIPSKKRSQPQHSSQSCTFIRSLSVSSHTTRQPVARVISTQLQLHISTVYSVIRNTSARNASNIKRHRSTSVQMHNITTQTTLQGEYYYTLRPKLIIYAAAWTCSLHQRQLISNLHSSTILHHLGLSRINSVNIAQHQWYTRLRSLTHPNETLIKQFKVRP